MKYAIRVENLIKNFPGITAVNNLSLNVKKGSVHGLLGPNGAGKTTTMNILAGLFPPSEGVIEIFGKPYPSGSMELRELIGLLPENPPLYDDMTGTNYLNFVGSLYFKDKGELKKNLDRAIQLTQIGEFSHRLLGNLSKGQRQRVAIAATLLPNPPLLIFDEPTTGLDPQNIVKIKELIRELKQEHTLLVSTHLLHHVSEFCTDLSIINKGKVIVEGSLYEVMNQINRKKSITALLENWNKDVESKYQQLPFVDEIKTSPDSYLTKVEFTLSDEKDRRSQLSAQLVEDKCGILQFTENQIGLEDIFLELVASDSSKEGPSANSKNL